MKGLLLTNDFPPMGGGEARYYARLCETRPSRDVIVLAPALAGDAEFDGRQAYRIERRRVPLGHHPAARLVQLLLFLIAAAVLVKRHRVEKVHVGHLYLGPVAVVLRLLYGIPYVLYLHGGEMAPYLRRDLLRGLVRWLARRADAVVVNSSFTRRHFEEMGIRHPRTHQLTMAVDVPRFAARVDPSAGTKYVLNGEKVLLTVGRLVERKGHDTIIRAMGDIAAHAGPVRYLIAGAGPHERRLRDLARRHGVEDHVHFLGSVSDEELPGLYAACDVFVMPSRELAARDGVEGFGIAFLEAAAAGKPSVAGRSGGIPDAVEDGVTGLLVAPDDVEEVAAAVVRLLNDQRQAQAMGARGRERAASLEARWDAAVREIWGLS